jgi:hypothetical protein
MRWRSDQRQSSALLSPGRRKLFVLSVILITSFIPLSGQYSFSERPVIYRTFFTDSLRSDSAKIKVHSPKKAAIMSACLPGLGQAYNHKWWKIPVIYAGFGGLGFGFAWNQNYYHKYHMALKYRYDGDPSTIDPYPDDSDDDLVTLKNYYRKYRDLCVIGAAALYTINIIDATVDAHLWNFKQNIGPDLSLNVNPVVAPGIFTGMRCVITLR